MEDTLTTLVLAAQGGDLDAFGRVVERFQDMAYAVAYTMVGDAHLAEDAAQEAFIEAFVCLPKLREPAAFPGWFRRIVVKRGDRLVRGKGLAFVPLDAASDLLLGGPDPALVAETRELQRRVHGAIQALPESDRLLIMLFYLASYSQQEIAAILELPLTTVKKRLFSARRRLRRRMDDFVRERLEEQRPVHDDQFARTIQFFIAVRIGDIAKVRAYLDQDPTLLNMHERWDEATALRYGLPIVSWFTPLHRAAYNGDLALVAFLLGRHADVNARTRSGQTPLHIAVLINYPAVVAQLLDGAANPNHATDKGLTPLHYAVILDRRELALLLLDAGARCQIVDRYGRTSLDWAVVKGHEDIVMLLRARQLV